MSAFTYTPYDGSTTPFTIGLQQLDPTRWFEPDDRLARDLQLKQQLIAEKQSDVFQALPDTEEAQAELLALMLEYLPAQYPSLYQSEKNKVHIPSAEITLDLEGEAPPLLVAGQLVQDDLCLVRVTDEGPVLVAASLCFPSSWSLHDKIGRHLDTVHDPVPGYRHEMADKVNRMMAHLPADRIIWRMNWSLDEGPELHRPYPHSHDNWLEAGGDPLEHVYVRVERQTLRRLPQTGDILFTIRIYSDPLAHLKTHPEVQRLAQHLSQQIAQLSKEELAYKGLSRAAPAIRAALETIS
jgi:hypothetical protein